MATTTTRLSLRKPATSDTVNVETDLNDNYDTIDTEMGFQPLASNPSSPYTGKTLFRTDQGKYYVWNGVAWTQLLDVSGIMSPQSTGDSTERTTTSTSYTSISPSVNITFIPSSTAVYITVTGAVEASAPQSVFLSFEVREDDASGSVVYAADEDTSVAQQDAFFHNGSTRTLVTGLTAGETYFVRTRERVDGGTGRFFSRYLLVEPVLNP